MFATFSRVRFYDPGRAKTRTAPIGTNGEGDRPFNQKSEVNLKWEPPCFEFATHCAHFLTLCRFVRRLICSESMYFDVEFSIINIFLKKRPINEAQANIEDRERRLDSLKQIRDDKKVWFSRQDRLCRFRILDWSHRQTTCKAGPPTGPSVYWGCSKCHRYGGSMCKKTFFCAFKQYALKGYTH